MFKIPQNLFVLSKTFFILLLSVFISAQSTTQAGDLLEDSPSPPPTKTITLSPFAEAILGEYDVFKRCQSGVATPADFLAHKTAQLKSDELSLEDKQGIALSIHYILHGHVFEMEPAAPSEMQAINLIYARAAMFASIVPGIKIPEFSSPMMEEDQSYHRELIEAATGMQTTAASSTNSGLKKFMADLALSERDALLKLNPSIPETTFTPAQPTAKATNYSDGPARWLYSGYANYIDPYVPQIVKDHPVIFSMSALVAVAACIDSGPRSFFLRHIRAIFSTTEAKD